MISGKRRLERTARVVRDVLRQHFQTETEYEPSIEVAQTPYAITLEFELPNNERWVVMVTGKEVVL